MADRVTRRAVVTGIAAALAGCAGGGESSTPTADPENPALGDAEQLGDLRLASPAFEDGGAIPRQYGHDAQNVNPPLVIHDVPSAAESLVLVVDDPDAVEPAGRVWLHWLVWNVPASRTEIPEDWTPATAVEGVNDFGNRGYDGPDPPDGPHTYRFKLYALDRTLDLPASAGEREVGSAMGTRRVAQTQLTGTYAP